MSIDTIKAWELSQQSGATELTLPDMSGLDAITRQLPQGFYTTFRTYGGGKRVLGLRAHLQRLYRPAAAEGINASIMAEGLRQNLAHLLQTFPGETRVRLILTREGRVYCATGPLMPLPPETYSHGVEVVTTGVERQNPRMKSTSFISSSQEARKLVAESQVFEALLVRNGFILEGMTSNFFYVKEAKVGTARNGILLGVTRQTVLRVARGIGLEIVYRPLGTEQVSELDEAFLTSSSRGIVPVVKIDEKTVGEGMPGPITRRLMEAYQDHVLRAAEAI